ncbi:DUF5020 family protein [Saccharicrinis fermentans]|uniref:DUF5020 domain-containing protein n=1 Tax=Saccharicrinis fermentans DSM 9555 = JCM 21142 TaxID=869213 RepID=W7Y4Q6_9BACT|nr:DUF5020 family protein [Saccharicrinis fermentans]GAF03062.1 hypothetical protein JCM21142_41718 [Saccharicrinis fermentans DSM 9555 = JCM 21142]
MKKLLFVALVLAFVSTMKAQNVQLHYDFGEERQMFTTTFEMFKPDKMGSTFFFIDLDYDTDKRGVDNGVSLAYMEIARSFKWNETQKLEPRIEFNSGNAYFGAIKNAWLVGAQYTFNNADFSKILTVQANLKHIQDGKINEDYSQENLLGFQLTAVWGLHFADRKISVTGFADFWREDNYFNDEKFVFLAEPQFWYNFNKTISLGTEIEMSNNFADDKFVINPTLAAKWTF